MSASDLAVAGSTDRPEVRAGLLLVEDDARLARLLIRVFREDGYSVCWCPTGNEGLREALVGSHDALVLDWMLPDLDGLSLCRELRRGGCRVPILMLTARGELHERVLGLTTGADDYIVKPFEIDELTARIRALLRRAHDFNIIRLAPLEIDRERRILKTPEHAQELTVRELDILLYLLQRPNVTVTRGELRRAVFGTRAISMTNVVDVHIRHLRRKLGRFAHLVESQPGPGYRLCPDVLSS